jgi:predicted nucleic acid-binding protein
MITFVDTNIFIRYMANDDKCKAKACFDLFQRVKRNEEEVTTSESVLAEVTFVLSSKKLAYQLTHEQIRQRLVPLLTLKGFKLPHKKIYLEALDIYAAKSNLDMEDALSIAHIKDQGLSRIYSYDTDFDAHPQVTCVEPL